MRAPPYSLTICLAIMSSFSSMNSVCAADQVASIDTQVIEIDEWDNNDGSMGLKLTRDAVKAGAIKFVVNNKTTRNLPHEILVIPAPKDIKDLPLEGSGAKLDEEKIEGLQEGVELEPGKSESKVLTLAPGSYLVFCNEAGHFMAGMHHVLTVSP
jgi:uncharacterized cupredoxin-like copper-binding protein